MTFAPELNGADKLPAAMRKLGILPSVGPQPGQCRKGRSRVRRGKVCCTHLYNAMSGLDHRGRGLPLSPSTREWVYVELNPDGTHVAPELFQVTRRAKSADRIVLISDAS